MVFDEIFSVTLSRVCSVCSLSVCCLSVSVDFLAGREMDRRESESESESESQVSGALMLGGPWASVHER